MALRTFILRLTHYPMTGAIILEARFSFLEPESITEVFISRRPVRMHRFVQSDCGRFCHRSYFPDLA